MSLVQNRIVVKVGTSTLTNDLGQVDLRSFDHLALVCSDIQNMGLPEVVLVSSRAIAVGVNKLGLKSQALLYAAQAGSCRSRAVQKHVLYDKFFGDYDKTIGQGLLNASDIEREESKENLTNTFNTLLELGIIPVVNENDSVSYTEIESKDQLFGDNDMLSAVVAVLVRARKLVIFSDIDGFYDKDPVSIRMRSLSPTSTPSMKRFRSWRAAPAPEEAPVGCGQSSRLRLWLPRTALIPS